MQPETELSSDILQPIPLEEWPVLQQLLKVDWPRYAYYFYWIQNSTKWKKLDPDLNLQIHCPNGKYKDDATFVGISILSSWRNVLVFTKELSGRKLQEAIIQTKRIDWCHGIIFPAVHEYIQPIFFSAIDKINFQTNQGLEVDLKIPGCFRIKSADECANVELKVHKECYLGELNPSHLPIIHSVWPHADKANPESSLKLLQHSVTLNKCLGLFLKEGDALVSWAFHNEWHGLGVVQTLEVYKRRGYAKAVVNALAKQLGQDGISPVLFVIHGNTPSENIFASLNWKLTIPAMWILMKRYPPCTN